MMSRRSQRERKAPELFGCFAKRTAEELEEDEEDEAPQRRRARRQRRHHSEDEDAGDHDPIDEEGSEEEEEPQQTSAVRRGVSKGARTAGAAATRAAAHVPQPPSVPRSAGDMLSLIFACPALTDALLEPDGLRTISLVARDAASLAEALCARISDVAGLWHQLARRCNTAFDADGTTTEACAVVQQAIRADAARAERCNKSTATNEYRLTERDLAGLSFATRPNPIFWDAAPVKMYNKLEVLAIAHRKHGSAAGLQAARLAAKSTSEKAKATRSRNEEQRRDEMHAALEKAGLEGPESRRYRKDKAVQAFIKRGVGSAAGVAKALKAQVHAEVQTIQRRQKLRERLSQEQLLPYMHTTEAQAYIGGSAQHSLQGVVSGLKRQHEEATGRQQRRESILQLLRAEQLHELAGNVFCTRVPGMATYIDSGKGSEAAVMAATKSVAAVEQAARDAAVGRAQRESRMIELLQAEGLGRQLYNSAVQNYVRTGEGSEGAAVEAARQAVAAQAAAAQAREDRSARMHTRLVAAGLGAQEHCIGVQSYVYGEEGSEEEAMEAARQAQQETHLQGQRHVRMEALLQAEGLVYADVRYTYELAVFVSDGIGSEEEVLAAVKEKTQTVRERGQRRARIGQLLEAEGLEIGSYEYRVRALTSFIEGGMGSSQEAAMAAIRAVHREDVGKQQRHARVVEMLAAEGMPASWLHRTYALQKYAQYGEGSAEVAVADAKRMRDAQAAHDAAVAVAVAALNVEQPVG